MKQYGIRHELLRTGMGCFLFAASASAVNVLILPYAHACYGYAQLPLLLVCALAVCVFLWLGKRLRVAREESLEHLMRIMQPALCLWIFAIHLLLGYWMEYTPSGDNFMLYNGSQMLASDGNFNAYPDFGLYLARFSNQWGFLMLLTGFYKLLSLIGVSQTFFPVVLVQAVLYVAAVRSALRLARRLRGVRGEAMLAVMLALCLPLYLAASVLYTDTFSLPFILLTLEKAYDVMDREGSAQLRSALLCGLYAFVGGQIKMTVAIALIASIIVWALKLKPVRALLCGGLCAAMMVLGTLGIQNLMIGSVIDPVLYEQYNTPPIHWFMMSIPTGDNPYGGFSGDYATTWGLMDDQPHETVMASIYTRIKDRIYTLRYPNRLITATLRKNSAFMGDGTFGMTEMLDDKPVRENVISSFVLGGRPHYKLYQTLCTGVFMAHVLIAAFGALRDIRCHDLRTALPCVALFGAMLFLMLWEARSRYLWGYVPVFLLLSGVSAVWEKPKGGRA